MIAIAARIMLLTFAALFVVAGSITAASAPESPLREVFSTDCPHEHASPCFIGIQAGATPIAEARARLEAHPWVLFVEPRMTMDYFGVEHLRFRWREPGLPEGDHWNGELLSSRGVVSVIRLDSALRFGDIWEALGHPHIIAYNGQLSRRVPNVMFYSTFFSDNTAAISNALNCPLGFHSILQGTVRTLELRSANLVSAGLVDEWLANPALLMQDMRATRSVC